MNASRAALTTRVVIVVVLMTSAAGCGRPQTVGEAARVLAGKTKYSEDELARALKAANGSKTLSDDAAKGLDAEGGAVQKLLDATNEVADAACAALEAGLEDIFGGSLDLLKRGEANELLDEMKSEVDAGEATLESIGLVCDAKDALSEF